MRVQEGRDNLPWWLEAGVEECGFCFAAVHYEVFYHCHDCDRPICPTCSLTIVESRTLLCPDCSKDGNR